MSLRHGETVGPDPHLLSRIENTDPETVAAATRAVLLRVERGQLSRADAYRILEALGLRPYESGGRWDPQGRRYRPHKTRRRPEEPPKASEDVGGSPNYPEDSCGVLGSTEGERGAS